MATQINQLHTSDSSELILEHQMMLSKISHEIRNPVTLINSFLQLVETHHPELSNDYYWMKVMENMDFLKLLLHEFSEFNNSQQLHMEQIDFFKLFHETVESAKLPLETRNITIDIHSDTSIPPFMGDKIKLKQLILNLLKNSGEAITASGTIFCSLSYSNHKIFMTIKDDGTGIPEEYQKDLFAPFVTHKQDGTGLGLAICEKIVSAHKGTISYNSKPGNGTTFTICFPVC